MLIITFGLIEFSSAYQSSSVASAAARTAARTASAEALLPDYATDAAAAAATALKTVPADEPVEMWVYRANDKPGIRSRASFYELHARSASSTPGSRRLRTFDTASPTGGGWACSTQNACNTTNWDSVGVYVKLNHKYMTKLFGANINLADHAVFRLEPAPTQLCP